MLHSTDTFDEIFKSFSPDIQKEISDKLVELSHNPKHNTPFLKGLLKGKRKLRRGKIRLEFAICEECRRLEHEKYNKCADCEQMRDNTIKMIKVGYRGGVYK